MKAHRKLKRHKSLKLESDTGCRAAALAGVNIVARILIAYGSTHGHTTKVVARLAETLRRAGSTVDVCEAAMPACRPDEYDGVIVAASVHAGGYQKPVRRWAKQHASVLNRKPAAFVSVCLATLQRDPKVQRELGAIIDRFSREAGWTPTIVKPVAGALLYTRYNWFLRRIMKHIAGKAGGDTDTARDYEYTDWKDLDAFAEQFCRQVGTTTLPTVSAVGA